MQTIDDLDELASLIDRTDREEDLYVRWSKGPDADLPDGEPSRQSSRDALTGITLPGLSANPLRVEPWWGDRPVRLWVARRLYDYRHLGEAHRTGVRPWIFVGEQRGRGPDNEPLVICRKPVAWISEKCLRQCDEAVQDQGSNAWGPLNRTD